MAPRTVDPGAEQKVENLERLYKRLETTSLADAPPEPEELDRVNDPWGVAKRASMDVVRSVPIIAASFGLSAAEVIFMVELAAILTFNAEDCPLPPEKINAAREAAFAYYSKHINEIPSVKKPKRRR